MADLFSRSFHCLLFPFHNLPPKPSERFRISNPIPLPKRWVSFTHHTHMLANSTSSSSSSSPDSDHEEFDILTSTEHSDGSFLFRFANASEIREKKRELEQEKLASDDEGVEERGEAGVRTLLSEGVEELNTEAVNNLGHEIKAVVRTLLSEGVEELNTEADRNIGNEVESSSVVVVGVADQNPQLPMNEKESVVLNKDSESKTHMINDSQKNDRHLKLDSIEGDDSQPGILSEDVATECNVFQSVSGGDSEADSQKEAVVPTVIPESDMSSDLNGGASGEVEEEEADKGYGVDRATSNLADGVDADSSELVPVSTSSESEQVVHRETNNLTGDVDTDLSESLPASTSVESEQVVLSTTNDLTGGVDANFSESAPALSSLETEYIVQSATNNLAGGVDTDLSESVPESTSLEFEQIVQSTTNNLSGADDADLSELVPASTSIESESEQVVESTTNNLTGDADADLGELVPESTSLESEAVANTEETTHLIVEDTIDACKTGKPAMLHDLVPSSDLEEKIDVGTTEGSDYESPSHHTVLQINSVETASHVEKTSKMELFLDSGAACLPHPSKALTGREDAYFVCHQNWLAVADGVGLWSLEGSNTGLYIREFMEKCKNIVSNYENLSRIKPAEVIAKSAAETESPGSSAVLVAHFDGEALHVANVGNTGFMIIRDGSIFKKSTPTFHEFNFPLQIVNGDDPSELIEGYTIDLNDGDVVITATNGLFDNLYEQEMASIISKSIQASLRPQEIAEFLAMGAQEIGRSTSTRSPFADAAQAVGYVGYTGGKLDDVTVIVSLVQSR